MIKFEYKPNVIDTPFGAFGDPPPVESVTMTLGGDVSWDEAVCEFKNFLRASGYVIPYDFEDDSNIGVAFEDESNTDVAVEALEEAVYLLNPTDEDMQKKAGVYRVVSALEKLKEKNTP